MGKIQNLSTPALTMYRLVYYLVYYDCKNYRDFFVRRISGLISKSGSMVDTFSRKILTKPSGTPQYARESSESDLDEEFPSKKYRCARDVVL